MKRNAFDEVDLHWSKWAIMYVYTSQVALGEGTWSNHKISTIILYCDYVHIYIYVHIYENKYTVVNCA